MDATVLDERSTFDRVQDALLGDRRAAGDGVQLDVHRRALAALAQGTGDDIAALVRQVLQRETLRTGADAFLDVPRLPHLPDEVQWRRHGCRVTDVGGGGWRVRAHPAPADGDGVVARLGAHAAGAGLRRTWRRTDTSCPADPFFAQALGDGFATYRSAAQRQATRAVAVMAPGSVLAVNLATGQGKTEAVLAPALAAASARGAVSVLVVPTISLAQDLERRLRSLLPPSSGAFAYTSALDPAGRADLRRRVAHADVPVCVTSPESAVGSLRPSLRAAAALGRLAFLGVDEAHLVRDWGVDFRPAFAALGGLRRELVDAAPSPEAAVRAVHLSATFRPADVADITTEAARSPTSVIGAAALRPEPDYVVRRYRDDDSRDAAVLEAVAVLPRPLFLYTSLVDDARRWEQILRRRYRRVGCITGAVPGQERAEVLADLRGDARPPRVDIVVATSAFGLGISFDEVRSVVHACVPESIDRYYQEVGRGGRDGSASVGFMAWVDADLDRAAPLADPTVIGLDKARSRWGAMSARARHEPGGGTMTVDLTIVPPHQRSGPSDLTTTWNLVTLGLMARARMIERTITDDETGDRGRRPHAVVRVRMPNLADERAWREPWARVRADVTGLARERAGHMRALLEPGARVCEAIAAAYRPGRNAPEEVAAVLEPVLSCGTCDACGHSGPRPGTAPDPAPIARSAIDPALVATGQDRPTIVLAPPGSRRRRSVALEFLRRAIDLGAVALVVPGWLRDDAAVAGLQQRTARPLLLVDHDHDHPLLLPTVATAVVTDVSDAPLRTEWISGAAPGTTLLVAPTAPSPARADRTIVDRPPGRLVRYDDYLAGR